MTKPKFPLSLLQFYLFFLLCGFQWPSKTKPETEFEKFRRSFGPSENEYLEKLKRARELALLPLGVETSISQAECLLEKERIIASSPVNPFYLQTDLLGISYTFRFCETGDWFSSNESQFAQFGRPAEHLLREVSEESDGTRVETVLALDHEHRIVTIQKRTLGGNDGPFSIYALDSDGNGYLNDKTISNQASRTLQVFLSKDGKIPSLYRSSVHRDSSTLTKVHYRRSDREDWEKFEIVLPFIGSSGAYFYTQKPSIAPRYYSRVEFYLKDDKEFCAQGVIKKSKKYFTLRDVPLPCKFPE